MHQYVMIVPDGAADQSSVASESPLRHAHTPYMDFIAREGATGRTQTLYDDLPKESLVAQMGMLGWDPRLYYPGGRSSCELLAHDYDLCPGDVAFRANLATVDGDALRSYSAFGIGDEEAGRLIGRIQPDLSREYPDIVLYHHTGFRCALILSNSTASPSELVCCEPHEHEGRSVQLQQWVTARHRSAACVAERINHYLLRAAQLLTDDRANVLLPWSPSSAIRVPSFAKVNRFEKRAAVVGAMDFLCGLARAGGMSFVRVGNGSPSTDYRGKGQAAVQLLEQGYGFVCCHINGPDEASHEHNLPLKISTIELIDQHIVGPVLQYFQRFPRRLGGIMVVPDHYTNCQPYLAETGRRLSAHTADPVPFAVWNGRVQDASVAFSEMDAIGGCYGTAPVSHLDLLRILGIEGVCDVPREATLCEGALAEL